MIVFAYSYIALTKTLFFNQIVLYIFLFLAPSEKNVSTHKVCLHGEIRKFLISTDNPKYWDRQTRANSIDPDQMLQDAASDHGLYCLTLIQQLIF